MSATIDKSVDELLEYSLRRQTELRDFSPAKDRSECAQLNLSACTRLLAMLRNRRRTPAVYATVTRSSHFRAFR